MFDAVGIFVLIEILDYLALDDRVRLSRVCKRFYEAAFHIRSLNTANIRTAKSLFNLTNNFTAFRSLFTDALRHIDIELNVTPFALCKNTICTSRMKNVHSVSLKGKTNINRGLLHALPLLTHLKLSSDIFDLMTLTRILKSCKYLERLELCNFRVLDTYYSRDDYDKTVLLSHSLRTFLLTPTTPIWNSNTDTTPRLYYNLITKCPNVEEISIHNQFLKSVHCDLHTRLFKV